MRLFLHPAALIAAMSLTAGLSGCSKAQVTLEIAVAAPDARGQARLCDDTQPLNPVRDMLTATLKACDGKGDAIVTVANGDFGHCEFGPVSKRSNATYRFRIEGSNCVAQP